MYNQVAYYIYNTPDSRVREVRCTEDGAFLMEIKGTMAFIVTSPGLPLNLIKSREGVYIRKRCLKCDTVYNILIITMQRDTMKP